MKRISTRLLAGTLTACGGGGTGTTLGSAALRGTVATGADGSFHFNRIPAGSVTIAFGTRTGRLPLTTDDDASEDEDAEDIRL